MLATVGTPRLLSRNASPPHYKNITYEDRKLGTLKADVFMRADECLLGVPILGEYDGHYHIDPDHHFHAIYKLGRQAGFERLTLSDKFKRLIEPRETGTIAFFISGNDSDRNNLPELAQRIVNEIETVAPGVKALDGYLERRTLVLDPRWIAANLFDSPESTVVQANQVLINRDETHLHVVAYDPLTERLTFRCDHHTDECWTAHFNNFGSNNGYGCTPCKSKTVADLKRLGFSMLVERAMQIGITPLFKESEYTNNWTYMHWQCTAHQHAIFDSWAHLEVRSCSDCRKDDYFKARQRDEFTRLEKIVTARGDEMLSTFDDYINQTTPLKIQCHHCGETFDQDGNHISRLQEHRCQQMAGARRIRTKRAIDLVMNHANVLGIKIEGGIENWSGRETRLSCLLPGHSKPSTLSANTIHRRYAALEHSDTVKG
jgi:hypothetical protein